MSTIPESKRIHLSPILRGAPWSGSSCGRQLASRYPGLFEFEQVGGAHYAVRAREAAGEERQELFDAILQRNGSYEQYRRATNRRIPLVVLQR